MNHVTLKGKAAIEYIQTVLQPRIDEPVLGLQIAGNEVDGDGVDDATLSQAIDACDEDPSLVTYCTAQTKLVDTEEDVKKINIENLCEALTNKKISVVKINFDGSGDSGQIEYMGFYDEKEKHVPVEDVYFKYLDFEKLPQPKSVTDFLEDLIYDLLSEHYGGWEINGGSFGEIEFDATTGNMKIDFNERVVEVNHSLMYLDKDGKVINEEE